ncbi:MAG TPA: sigma-70 family RNA polymerase sigma factor [Tepidisphaeraceae bacterium]|nr:sigma-70 family RNA polymerase sigma factor [Tepidisphaeraceae bacterium]
MSDVNHLTKLVADRSAALTLYARQWLDASSADDVLQEAVTALLMQRPAPDDPLAWTFRVIRNAAIDHARSAARRRQRERAVAATRQEWFDAQADSPLDAQSAEAALRLLSDISREIVVLRIWGDVGFTQIAEIVNLSPSTVHNRYTAALEQMRHALENPSCQTKTR